MNKLIMVCLVVFLSGCMEAAPNLINGKYYMAGDSVCSKVKVRDSNTIECYNSKGEYQGWRSAMTDQQLQMYMHKQQMEAQSYRSYQPSSSKPSSGYIFTPSAPIYYQRY